MPRVSQPAGCTGIPAVPPGRAAQRGEPSAGEAPGQHRQPGSPPVSAGTAPAPPEFAARRASPGTAPTRVPLGWVAGLASPRPCSVPCCVPILAVTTRRAGRCGGGTRRGRTAASVVSRAGGRGAGLGWEPEAHPTLSHSTRPLRWAAEEFSDLHRVRLLLHSLRPLLGPVPAHPQGEETPAIPVPLSLSPCPTLPVPDPHRTPTERLRGGDTHGLPAALHQRGRAGWGRETGTGQGGSLGQAGPLPLRARGARAVGSALTLLLVPFASHRRAAAAKPGRGAQKNSASRSSPRSWCSVSFGQRDGDRDGGVLCGGGRWVFADSPLSPWLLDVLLQT